MKNLSVAFGISLGASIVLFFILHFILHMDAHGAAGIAGLPFIASHHLCEMLERTDAKRNLATTPEKSIYTFDGFAISWKLMIIYGSMVIAGMMQAFGLVGLLVGSLFFGPEVAASEPKLTLAISLPLNLLGCFFVGRWIGTRCQNTGLGILVVLAVPFLGIMAAKIVDFALVSPEDFKRAYDQDKSFFVFLQHVLFATPMFWIPALLGFWRGHVIRLARYLRYLLSILPKDTREVLVNLAYEEAQNLATQSVKSAPRSPPPPPPSRPQKPSKIPVPA
jgi:hypothetical protein